MRKRKNLMDIHMKKWTGYGRTRLSTVSFSSDPIPQSDNDVIILNLYEPSCDDIKIPTLSIDTTHAYNDDSA